MNKVHFLILAIVALGGVSAFGQSGAEIDALLGTGEVSVALAARFVLPAADVLPADAKAELAFSTVLEKGWLPPETAPDSPIKLSTLSLLVMKAFDLPGGMMYRIASSPRYAYRELLYLKLIQGISDPSQTVSGERLMRILGRALDYKGGES
jgi:hypothetical protein